MYKKVYYKFKVFFFFGQLDLSVFLIVLVVFAVQHYKILFFI